MGDPERRRGVNSKEEGQQDEGVGSTHAVNSVANGDLTGKTLLLKLVVADGDRVHTAVQTDLSDAGPKSGQGAHSDEGSQGGGEEQEQAGGLGGLALVDLG